MGPSKITVAELFPVTREILLVSYSSGINRKVLTQIIQCDSKGNVEKHKFVVEINNDIRTFKDIQKAIDFYNS